MLKYQKILEKLTVEQKISLLTDRLAFSDPAIRRAGVPDIRFGALADFAAERSLSFGSLANTWDVALIEEAAEDISAAARGKGYKLLTTSDIKPALNPYGAGLSEDPFLTGAYGGAMLRGIRNAGAAAALADYSLSAQDIEYLDVSLDARMLNDLVKKPFSYATEAAVCDGVCASLAGLCDGYRSANTALFGEAVAGGAGDPPLVYSKPTAGLPDFHAFLQGCVCVEGGGVALGRALGRYDQLTSDHDEGSITSLEVQTAIDAGLAISRKTLDEAVDRLIDFAFRVNQILPHAHGIRQDLDLALAQASIVLLKNEGLLPLAQQTKLLAVGDDFGFAKACSSFEVTIAEGYAPGAALDKAIADTVRASKQAKVIVVFLKSEKRPRLRLPPDALALIDALSGTHKPMIAVVLGDFPVDFSFDSRFSAVLSAPRGGAACAAAVESVLTGAFNPCGRLARSVPNDADAYYAVLKNDKDYGRTKVGPFVGYRYYDTAGQRIRYPFGYGLSYTTFRYADLELGANEVSFTVRNTGKRAGVETAQLYIGAPEGGEIRPKKELKGFARVALEAGERKRVSIPLPEERFATFDASNLSEGAERGLYLLYVGASVQDIRLTAPLVREGEARVAPKEHAEDYFRDLSNIGKAYRVDVAGKKNNKKFSLPRRIKWLHYGALWLLLLTLFLATVGGFVFFSSENPAIGGMVFLLVDLGFSLFAVIALCYEHQYREKRLQTEMTEQMLNFPQAQNATTPESVFDAAFEKKTAATEAAHAADEPHYFDPSFTFRVAAQELRTFLREQGLLLDEKTLCSFLAAMAASHCAVVRAEDRKHLNRFLELLCRYFGTDLFAGNLLPSKNGTTPREEWVQFNAVKAVYEEAARRAEADKNHVHICLFRHFESGLFSDLTAGTKAKQSWPENLFLILETETLPGALSRNLVQSAAVIPFAARETTPSAEKTAIRPMGSYQWAGLCRRVREEFPLDERLWKRVDRLEEACGETGTYRLPNRLWINAEKFISTFIACGNEPAEALDLAVMATLLPAIESDLCRGKTDEEVIALLEEIFGEGEIGGCRAYFDRAGKKAQRGEEKNG